MTRCRERFRGGAAAALALLGACASMPLPPVDARLEAVVRDARLSLHEVANGRNLLLGDCAACHQPVHPLALTLAKWDAILPRMLRKSALTPDDGRAVRSYVVAVQRAAAAR